MTANIIPRVMQHTGDMKRFDDLLDSSEDEHGIEPRRTTRAGRGAAGAPIRPHPHDLLKSRQSHAVQCMQFHRFDLNLLIALDTLLREKNITRAAEKVFVSQPAMSAALHRLREYFGDPLLVRVGRDMDLSPRGQSLVDPVREALLLIQT